MQAIRRKQSQAKQNSYRWFLFPTSSYLAPQPQRYHKTIKFKMLIITVQSPEGLSAS
jgi:hypothetical protein